MWKVIKKYWYILLIIALIGIIFWTYPRGDSSPIGVNVYINKINSLQSEIDSITTLRDSIDRRIDTVTVTIEKTHIQYEKDYTTIINNTTSEDYVFFLEYIRSNKARLDSINNF